MRTEIGVITADRTRVSIGNICTVAAQRNLWHLTQSKVNRVIRNSYANGDQLSS